MVVVKEEQKKKKGVGDKGSGKGGMPMPGLLLSKQVQSQIDQWAIEGAPPILEDSPFAQKNKRQRKCRRDFR